MAGRRPRRCQSNAQLRTFLHLTPSFSSLIIFFLLLLPSRLLLFLPPPRPLPAPGPGDGGGRRAGGAGRPMRYRAGAGKGRPPRPLTAPGSDGDTGNAAPGSPSLLLAGCKPTRGVPGHTFLRRSRRFKPSRGSRERRGMLGRAFLKSVIWANIWGGRAKSGCLWESPLKSRLITRWFESLLGDSPAPGF